MCVQFPSFYFLVSKWHFLIPWTDIYSSQSCFLRVLKSGIYYRCSHTCISYYESSSVFSNLTVNQFMAITYFNSLSKSSLILLHICSADKAFIIFSLNKFSNCILVFITSISIALVLIEVSKTLILITS